MGQLIWQVGLVGMVAVAALFLLSIFDIALLEGQCQGYCGECYSNTNVFKWFTVCEENASRVCLKDCEKRGVSCDYDTSFRKYCENCTKGCGMYPVGSGEYGNCTQQCYS
jgi:hypothetical protein